MREEFPETVKAVVAPRVGHRCSNPSCGHPTSGPGQDSEKAINIGVAAHISAASPGGPRYDPSLSREDRKSVKNAIWLCQNCAKLIDSDETRYTGDVLREWRRSAEESAHKLLREPDSLYDLTALPGFSRFLDSLSAYVGEGLSGREPINIGGYLEWIRGRGRLLATPEVERIADVLGTNPTAGDCTLRALTRNLASSGSLDLVKQTRRMAEQLDLVYDNLLRLEESQKERHRLQVCARLLEIASRNLVGSGMRSDLASSFVTPTPGTLAFRWRIGKKSPEMMLIDLVGGVLENRISVILKPNSSLLLRAYDPVGHKIVIPSGPYLSGSVLVVAVVWRQSTISLWIKGDLVGRKRLRRAFNAAWSIMLAGIDIEGELGASMGRQGYTIDGLAGVNLGRDGVWEGARLSDLAIWNCALSWRDIKGLAVTSDAEVERLKRRAVS